MANAKDIRNKISSVRNTQKITRAMQMVAASKMRKAQERMAKSRPYSDYIRRVMGHLAKANPEYRDQYLQIREEKRVGIIVVSSDRGLCGGLNVNLFKAVVKEMAERSKANIAIELCTIGSKSEQFFRRHKAKITANVSHLGDTPALTSLIGIVKVLLDKYRAGDLDAIYVAYNQFVNTMSQKPQFNRLLPFVPVDDEYLGFRWDYLYEPDAKVLLDTLCQRYIESQVYQAAVENVACALAAQMVAMKSASDNAAQIITDLRLAYNKARQAAITRELSEIVAGADAV